MNRVAVIGAGLIGCSLLRALKAAGSFDLLAIDADTATRESVRETLGVPVASDLNDARAANVIVLALPIPALLASFEPLSRALAGQKALVTDVAGIKAPVLKAAKALPDGITFVGGHPMAGKEHGGFAHSDEALFRDRVVAVCPPPGTSEESIQQVESLWRAAGARPLRCDADSHDHAVARVSHLPYLVASSLAQVAGRGDELSKSLAAGGLRDTTRVAEDPTVRFAAALNPAVPMLAREVAAELRSLADALEHGDAIDRQLDAAANARRSIFTR